jgi:hypothetical protein
MAALLGVTGDITLAPIYDGITSLTKTAPCIVCYAESAAEDFPGSGNYKVLLKVSCKSPAEPDGTGAAAAAHQLLCATVFDWCKEAGLAQALTDAAAVVVNGNPTVPDFCVQGATDKGLSAGVTPDGDSWINTIELELYACASNLS